MYCPAFFLIRIFVKDFWLLAFAFIYSLNMLPYGIIDCCLSRLIYQNSKGGGSARVKYFYFFVLCYTDNLTTLLLVTQWHLGKSRQRQKWMQLFERYGSLKQWQLEKLNISVWCWTSTCIVSHARMPLSPQTIFDQLQSRFCFRNAEFQLSQHILLVAVTKRQKYTFFFHMTALFCYCVYLCSCHCIGKLLFFVLAGVTAFPSLLLFF